MEIESSGLKMVGQNKTATQPWKGKLYQQNFAITFKKT